jgi:hypothetical protein
MTPVGTINRCIDAGAVKCIEHGFFMSKETIMARMAKEGLALLHTPKPVPSSARVKRRRLP